MADTLSSGGSASNRVRVQISSPAPFVESDALYQRLFFVLKNICPSMHTWDTCQHLQSLQGK